MDEIKLRASFVTELSSNRLKSTNEVLGNIQKKKVSIAIIKTMWNNTIVRKFCNLIISQLEGYDIDVYDVPGSFEIPFVAARLCRQKNHDVIICLGTIIKGESAHFEYISTALMFGLMRLQTKYETPIINGVLNCYTEEQATKKYSDMDLAKSLSLTALNMVI
jgi:6,7-dimethyl-8-ribityllumazine synthase